MSRKRRERRRRPAVPHPLPSSDSPNEAAVRLDDEPEAAEVVHVLALDLTRTLVSVVVERPAVVGHLETPVAPANGADQSLFHALHRLHLPLREVDGPSGGTGAVAGALATALVARERVEHTVLAVEEDCAVPRVPHLECPIRRGFTRRGRSDDCDRSGDGEQGEKLLHRAS